MGADSQLGNTGYAQYGLDNLTFGSTGVDLPGAIIGSINTTGLVNTTQYLLGYFGVGVVPGSFGSSLPLSAISGLVEKEDAIPSHSYGFTAGAKYRESSHMVAQAPFFLTGYRTKRSAQFIDSWGL